MLLDSRHLQTVAAIADSGSLTAAARQLGRSLQAVAQDVRAQGFDHIAVTGDLANISLPQEFHLARAWLDALGPFDRVTVVPGNHDAYVGVDWERGLRHWAPFMTGDDGKEPKGGQDFPFLRVRCSCFNPSVREGCR